MDFALKILRKHGWKEGEGLGKNSNGIAKPLKANLKFDKAGFGADQSAEDFNNHWWERVFNEASNNVNVKQDGDTIKIDLKDDEECVEISTKGYSMKKLNKSKRLMEKDNANGYDNFLRAATLTNLGNEVENRNKIDPGDIEVTKIKVLTDEELFKACGGRTAHKGARHGLKLSGKLSRIEQQEEELLAKMLAKRKGDEDASKKLTKQKNVEKIENLEQEPIQKSKKKKKGKKIAESKVIAPVEEYYSDQIENNELKEKRKKRKHSESNYKLNTICLDTTEDEQIKKSKQANILQVEIETSTDLSTIHIEPKKKKKKKGDHIELENLKHSELALKKKKKVVSTEDSNDTGVHTKKKSKKRCEIIISNIGF